MSDHAQSFINNLMGLQEHDRGAFAHLKRSLGFAPGAYPRAYPYVERFVGAEKHADDPWRKALYLTAGLFAFHPLHHPGVSLAAAFGRLARQRGNASLEQRFIALLGAEPESLSPMLRQAFSLLAADRLGFDFVCLLDDLSRWFNVHDIENRDRIRQSWARDFYGAYEQPVASPSDTDAALS